MMNPIGSRNYPGLVPFVYFILGAFTMVMQTILLREFFVVAAGNEISFGIAMGGWLLGVGAGSLCGAFFTARRAETATAFSWTTLAMVAFAPLLLAAARSLYRLGAMPQGELLPLAKTFYLIPLLTVPISFFSGFAFPLAGKLRPLAMERVPRLMASAYAWECLGAVLGGAAYTFWLVGKFSPLLITGLISLPAIGGAAYVSWLESRKRALSVALLLLVVTAAALLSGTVDRLDRWLVLQRWSGISSSRLIAARDSKYQNLQLGFQRGQYSLYANGQLAAVFPDDEAQRILAAQILCQHPRPRDILVIGTAAGGLSKHLLRYRIASLTTVEIDAAFSGLISEHLGQTDREALRDPRLRMRIMDGRRFITLAAKSQDRQRDRFDLVFIHQPDAWTAQLNRYYTQEFFRDLKKTLTPGGVVVLRLTSSENYASEIVHPYTATIYHTLRSVFPVIAVSPGMTNVFSASAAKASVGMDADVLAERYRGLALPPADLAPVFSQLYPAEKTAFIRNALQKKKMPVLNRDGRPIAYFWGSRLLGWSSGTPLSGLFDLFERMEFAAVLLISGLLLLPLVLVSFLKRKSGPGLAQVLLSAASGGFSGLSFEITAIFIFQNTWGFVYQVVGMLIALFMLGLGAGAACTSRWLEKKPPAAGKAARWLAGLQLLIAMLNLTCLPLLRIHFKLSWPGQLALTAWLGCMGLLIGAILPLGMRVLQRLPGGQSAGFLNAGDYLGGAVGSLFMAAFFLPLLGTGNSLLLISLLSATSAVLLLLTAGPAAAPRR